MAMKSENWWKGFLLGTKQRPTRCQRDSAPSIGLLKHSHSLNARFQNDEGTDDITDASSKEDPFDDDGLVEEDSVKTSISSQSRVMTLSIQRTSLIRPQKTDDLLSFKFNYFCSLCNKQYNRPREIDNHLQSYDHAHKQRLRDLRRGELCRRAWFERRRRRLKKSKTSAEDKDFDRMMKFANERAEAVGTAIQMQQQQSLTVDIAVPSAPSETSDEGFSKQAICFDDNFKRNFLCRNEDGSSGSAIPSHKESAMDATTTMTKDSQRLPPTHVDVGGSAVGSALSNISRRKTTTAYLLKYSWNDHINRTSALRRDKRSRKNKSRKCYQQFQGSERFTKYGKSNFEEFLSKKKSQKGQTQQQRNGNSAKSRKVVGDRNRQIESSLVRRTFRGNKKEAVGENRCGSLSPFNCRISSFQKCSRKTTRERLKNCRQLCYNLKTVENIKDSLRQIKLRSNLFSASHPIRTCDKTTLAPNNCKVAVYRNKWLTKGKVAAKTRETECITDPSGLDRTSRYSQCAQTNLRVDLANACASAQFKTAKIYGDKEFTRTKLDQRFYDAGATDRIDEVISSTKRLNFYSKGSERKSSFESNSNSKTGDRVVRNGKRRSQENYFLSDAREKQRAFSERDFFQAIGPNDPLVFRDSVDKSEKILPLRLESTTARRHSNLTKRSFQWQPIYDSKKPKLKDKEGEKRRKSSRSETREQETHGCFAGILLLESKFPLNIGQLNEFLPAPIRGFNARLSLNDVQNIFLMQSECQPTLQIKPNVPLSIDSAVDHISPNHLPSSSLSSSSSSLSVKTPLSALDGLHAESICSKALEELASKGRSEGPLLATDAVPFSPLIRRRLDSSKAVHSTFLALLPTLHRGCCCAEVPPAVNVFKSTEPFRVCRSQVPQFLPSKVWLFGCRPRLAHEISFSDRSTGGTYDSFYGNAMPWNLCIPRHPGTGSYRRSNCLIDSQLFSRPHLVMIPLPLPVTFCMI